MKDLTDYESFKKFLDLKDFVTLKTDTLEFLVQEKGLLKVVGVIRETTYEFDVQVKHPTDREKPWDCKVGNFSINKFFRTKKGQVGERYKTLSAMLVEIKKGMESKLGAKMISYKIVNEGRRKR